MRVLGLGCPSLLPLFPILADAREYSLVAYDLGANCSPCVVSSKGVAHQLLTLLRLTPVLLRSSTSEVSLVHWWSVHLDVA